MEIDEKLEQLHEEDTTKGERYFARKFKSIYERGRKGLVIIKKARNDTINSKEAVEKAQELLERLLTDLEQ